jgi:hypothetical protein
MAKPHERLGEDTAVVDDTQIQEAVRRADLDELLRLIDTLCDERAWDALTSLRERCERAHETGRQLWPAAAHAAYRLALEAPAPWAAAVLVDEPAPFSLGPLPEVAAQHHTWAELAPHVSSTAAAVVTAHERVVRGDDLSAVEIDGPAVLELPWRLAEWEPHYAVAQYRSDKADFPAPELSGYARASLPTRPSTREVDDVSRALTELARTWTAQSNGRVDVVTVDGSALHAIAALGPPEARVVDIDVGTAIALMAWTGASGGAHGRRPGAAAGRFAAWWVAGALTEKLDEWPPEPAELGSDLASIRFCAWDAAEPATGWRLQLAIEDPDRGRAWAISAHDAA